MRRLIPILVLVTWPIAARAELESDAVAAVRELFEDWRYAEAEDRARQLLVDVEARHGPESAEVAQALDLVVEALWREAEAYRADTRIINDGVEGEVDHGGTWRPIDRDEARRLAEQTLGIKKAVFGETHAEVASSLDNLGSLLRSTGDLERARESHEGALEMRRSVLGADHPDVARSLSHLALVFKRSGDYARARTLYEEALAIRERVLDAGHTDLVRSFNNLAVVAEDVRDYEGARPLLESAVQVARIRPAGSALPAALRNQALLLGHMGELTEAAQLSEEALKIQERVAPRHPRMVGLLISTGWFQAMTGDLPGGRRFLERAVAVSQEIRPDLPLHAQALNNLAELQTAVGEYEGAIETLRRALAIKERFYEAGHVELETTLAPIGDAYYRSGDTANAKTTFERALSRYEETAPTSDVTIIFYLATYANVLRDTGEAARARRLYERLLANTERVFGPDHPAVGGVLREMARLSAGAGDLKPALAAALGAERIGRDHMRLITRGLSERQALLYATQRVTGLDLALSLMGKLRDPDSRRAVADSVVRSRALVLDEMAARHRSLGNSPEIAGLAGELRRISQRIANLAVRGPLPGAPEHYRNLLNSTLAERDRVERELARESAVFQQEQVKSKIGLNDVLGVLPPASALVAYVYYEGPPANPSTASPQPAAQRPVPSYAALVVRSGADAPDVLLLGEASEIDSRVERWRREIAAEPAAGSPASGTTAAASRERTYRESAVHLLEAIWNPLLSSLGASERVFVVPDGSLNLVNLAALPGGGTGYLVESGPLIHYLTTERDLVPREPRPLAGRELLAIGGPAYDERGLFAGLTTVGRGEVVASPVSIGASGSFRGARSGCGSFQALRFEALPASGIEVQEVVEVWRAAKGSPAADLTQLTGGAASEGAFKAEAPRHRFVHVASHGFFLGECRSAVYTSRGIGRVVIGDTEETSAADEGENPLLLSGLALAGANHRQAAQPEAEEDGILTAEEIAALDLSGVQWAVLSACDTGIGEVKAGEGVFGLRRAFQLAGVGTLVMSLWSVEDESARQWMRALYRARLLEGRDTAESAREASLKVLRSRRERGSSTHPFYWAGFVAAGDWR